MRKSYFLLFSIAFCSQFILGQEITQFEVFAGRYDYLAIGNTLNAQENGNNNPCELLSESSATLSLEADQSIIAAYLYWAGSGTGDFEVLLNDIPITAERTFADAIDDNRPFFAAFTDITSFIISNGLGEYTFSGLDLSEVLPTYCPSGTNFAGWSIIVVYEDLNLPLNQVNIFDGLESVSQFDNNLTIALNNLNVLDNDDAKIGFLAWEGDANLAVEETLSINGNLLSNPPLNPVNNQFNGTNTFTNANDLYNMDIDVYSIENNIAIGDTSATIELTSGQDFVMVNTIITVLNSQLPDAIIEIETVNTTCDSREIEVSYTVTNQGTEVLPANTEVAFYGDGILTGTDVLTTAIPMGGSQENTVTITVDNAIPDIFDLVAIVDDPEVVIESNEGNNESIVLQVNLTSIDLLEIPPLQQCDDSTNDGVGLFNLDMAGQLAINDQVDITIEFYTSELDAQQQQNSIADPFAFENTSSPQTVYLRFISDIDNDCNRIEPLLLQVLYQPVIIAQEPLTVCDDSTNNGIETFNLSNQSQSILNNQNGVLLSYFVTLQEAEEGLNAISNPEQFVNFTNPQTIYYRLENENNVACYDVGFFDLVVNPIGNVITLPNLIACNAGFGMGIFDLTEIEAQANLDFGQSITGYYLSPEDAQFEINGISDPFAFLSTQEDQVIYIRLDGDDALDCYELAQFQLEVENCPPFVPQGFSPNQDGLNDTFRISGLKNVFENYELLIYSRLGNLVYQGDNDLDFWDGIPNRGIGGTEVPTGVYYWVLFLNDSQNEDMTGWVYLNR
jgi:gliding motility-associated-like protein